jgi:uncharacterized protein YbdZ (MbtH family)
MSDTPNALYHLLVDPCGRHAIWPAGQRIPTGFRDTGERGTEKEILARIRQAAQDARDESNRRQIWRNS